MQKRFIRAGDIVRIRNEKGLWRITHTRPVGRGTQITATSINAYPRIDITTAESRATLAHQE